MKKFVLLFLSVMASAAQAQQLVLNSTTYYGGSRGEQFAGTIPTRDGGFLGFGSTNSVDGQIPLHTVPNTGFANHALVTKHDSLGVLQWARVYGGSESEAAQWATQLPDGGYAVCGWTTSIDGDIPNRIDQNPSLGGDAWIFRLDSAGNLLWSKIYGSSNSDNAWNIISTPDGGLLTVVLTGGNDSDAAGSIMPNGVGTDWLLIKTDAQGNRQWRKIIGGSDFETGAVRVFVAPGGGYYLVGGSYSHDYDLQADNLWPGGVTPIGGPAILRLSDSGQVLWCKRYGGSRGGGVGGAYMDTATGIITVIGTTPSNDYYFTGNHQLSGLIVWTSDAFVMNVDTGGNFLSAKLYGDSETQTAYCYGRRPDGTAILGCTQVGMLGFQDVALYVINAAGDSVSTLVPGAPRNDKPAGIFWRGGAWKVTGTVDSVGFSQGTTNLGGHPRGNLFVSRLEQWPASIPKITREGRQLTLVPNPTSGEVTCELPETVSGTLDVVASNGRMVLRQRLRRERRVQFSMSGLPSGTYIVTVRDESQNQRYSSPLIVR